MDRHGLVERRGRSRRRAQGTTLSLSQKPNQLWCTDYKGEFLLGNHQYCYPLTVTDHASRFLLTCEALSSTKEEYAFTLFEWLFKERGLPVNIRSDNGVPFASAHALFNSSKLAVMPTACPAKTVLRLIFVRPRKMRPQRVTMMIYLRTTRRPNTDPHWICILYSGLEFAGSASR
ncbi:MAG: DDE-type integrase/transposase/recombinase [Candidatus Acidiferrales bacterium]